MSKAKAKADSPGQTTPATSSETSQRPQPTPTSKVAPIEVQQTSLRLFGPSGAFTKAFNDLHAQKQVKLDGSSATGMEALNSYSKVSPVIVGVILRAISTHKFIGYDFITIRALQVLSEITITEGIDTVTHFVQRFGNGCVESSSAGYFLGMCNRAWKNSKRTILEKLIAQSDTQYSPPVPNMLSPLVTQAFYNFFTVSTNLSTDWIDETSESRILETDECVIVRALFEFSLAVMNRSDKIRNLNAYLMSIIKKTEGKQELIRRESKKAMSAHSEMLIPVVPLYPPPAHPGMHSSMGMTASTRAALMSGSQYGLPWAYASSPSAPMGSYSGKRPLPTPSGGVVFL